MDDQALTQFEAHLSALAGRFPYPHTPDVATALRAGLIERSTVSPRRRLAGAVLILVLAVGGFLAAAPQARATVFEALRLGAVRIFLGEPTSTLVSSTAPADTSPVPSLPTADGQPSDQETQATARIISLFDLAGETTLVEAQERVDFPIRLPTYPSEFGPPDHVFHQEIGGSIIVLVWMEPDRPEEIRLSLHMLSGEIAVGKLQPRVVRRAEVAGQEALWTEGPYLVYVEGVGVQAGRLVEGHVLIWVEGDVTYRLETKLPLDEAVRLAESLR